MSTTTTYAVNGMTCAHCVSAVTGEIAKLPGVRQVDVDLAAGGTSAVHVVSDTELEQTQVREAVSEAGFDLADGTP
jgi:copper chaperone CopZ